MKISNQARLLYYPTNGDLYKLCDLVQHTDLIGVQRILYISDNIDLNSNAGHRFHSPIHLAVCSGYYPMIELLLQYNANPNLYNKHGETPLWIAIQRGQLSFETTACKDNTKRDEHQIRNDKEARIKEQHDIIKLLFRYGADPDKGIYRNKKTNQTPLYLAIENYREDLVTLLLNHGADANKLVMEPNDGNFGQNFLCNIRRESVTVLSPSFDSLHYVAQKILHQLKEAYCCTSTSKTGKTTTAKAKEGQRLDEQRKQLRKIAIALLQHKSINPNMEDADGWTPLGRAVYEGELELVKILLDHGANPNLGRNVTVTPTAMSSWGRQVHGGVAFARVLQGTTTTSPLEFAVLRGFVCCARMLLDYGAKLSTSTCSGYDDADDTWTFAGNSNDRTEIILQAAKNCSSFADNFEILSANGKIHTLTVYKYSEKLPELFQLKDNLQVLHITGDEIKYIPDVIGNLVGLRQLIISDAKHLDSLPWTLKQLFKLEVLNISNCPDLRSIPIGVQEDNMMVRRREISISGCIHLEEASQHVITMHTKGNRPAVYSRKTKSKSFGYIYDMKRRKDHSHAPWKI